VIAPTQAAIAFSVNGSKSIYPGAAPAENKHDHVFRIKQCFSSAIGTWLLERTLKELSKNHLNIENGPSFIFFRQP
jgi:hypothetical protein